MQMKQILESWRSVTEHEYPQYVHLIVQPDEIDLAKLRMVVELLTPATQHKIRIDLFLLLLMVLSAPYFSITIYVMFG